MSKGAGKTGIGPAVVVAIEQLFPKEQRIIDDKMAYEILPFGMRTFVNMLRLKSMRDWMIRRSERDIPGAWGQMLARKRFIYDKFTETTNDIDAIVNVGAGFDTSVYRMTENNGLPAWEIDQPQNIYSKKKQISRIFDDIPSNINLVPIDFDYEKIDSVISEYNYSFNMKTFFIFEGVTQYLTQEGIESTFDFFSKAASGSKLVFTYVLDSFIKGDELYGWENGYEEYVVNKKIWLFGKNPEDWTNFLEKFGWKLIEDKDAKFLSDKYIKSKNRELETIPIERIIVAEKS